MLKDALIKDWQYKLLALFMGTTLWFIHNFGGKVPMNIERYIEIFNQRDGYTYKLERKKVRLKLSVMERFVSEEMIENITVGIDVKGLEEGEYLLKVYVKNVPLPFKLFPHTGYSFGSFQKTFSIWIFSYAFQKEPYGLFDLLFIYWHGNIIPMEGLEKRQRVLLLSIKGVAWLFDAFVILTLATVGIFLMVWIVYEFYLVMTGTLPLERGGLSILGSVLILYAISELLSEEIKHIKGGTVSIKAFVGVALAAVIRKVLILSLSPERFMELITLSLVLFSLGLVYWIIHKVESSS